MMSWKKIWESLFHKKEKENFVEFEIIDENNASISLPDKKKSVRLCRISMGIICALFVNYKFKNEIKVAEMEEAVLLAVKMLFPKMKKIAWQPAWVSQKIKVIF